MRRAGINLATVGVFSWALLEPREGARNFGWLDGTPGPVARRWHPGVPGHTHSIAAALAG